MKHVANLRIETIRFAMSVFLSSCPFVCQHGTSRFPSDEFSCYSIILLYYISPSVKKIHVYLKTANNNWQLTTLLEDHYTLLIIFHSVLLRIKVFHTIL